MRHLLHTHIVPFRINLSHLAEYLSLPETKRMPFIRELLSRERSQVRRALRASNDKSTSGHHWSALLAKVKEIVTKRIRLKDAYAAIRAMFHDDLPRAEECIMRLRNANRLIPKRNSRNGQEIEYRFGRYLLAFSVFDTVTRKSCRNIEILYVNKSTSLSVEAVRAVADGVLLYERLGSWRPDFATIYDLTGGYAYKTLELELESEFRLMQQLAKFEEDWLLAAHEYDLRRRSKRASQKNEPPPAA